MSRSFRRLYFLSFSVVLLLTAAQFLFVSNVLELHIRQLIDDDLETDSMVGGIPSRVIFVLLGKWQKMIDRSNPQHLVDWSQERARWLSSAEKLTNFDRAMIREMRRMILIHGNTSFLILDERDCAFLVGEVDRRLLEIFIHEGDLRYQSDICRLAALYKVGGYYIDADQIVLNPWMHLLSPNTSLVTTRADHDTNMVPNGFIGAARRHPVINRSMEIIIHGNLSRGSVLKRYGLGPRSLLEALQETNHTNAAVFIETYLNRTGDNEVDVPRQQGNRWCQFVFFDPVSRLPIFYSRMPEDPDCGDPKHND